MTHTVPSTTPTSKANRACGLEHCRFRIFSTPIIELRALTDSSTGFSSIRSLSQPALLCGTGGGDQPPIILPTALFWFGKHDSNVRRFPESLIICAFDLRTILAYSGFLSDYLSCFGVLGLTWLFCGALSLHSLFSCFDP